AAGVPCTLLPPDQLAALLQDPTTPANAFIRLLDQFLQLVGGSEDSLDTITQRAQTSRDQAFLTIFRAVYQRYQAQLAKTELLDFSSMITDARTALQSRAYVSRFRYVIVDEFQDISRQRLGLLQDLRAHVPHARLFAVGDDWQAIYRFAGSDVSIITSLPTLVGPTATVALDTTFRYPQEILDASARFVTQNPAQLTKQLRAYGGAAGVPPLVLVHQANDTPDAQTDALQAICADLMQQCAGAPASLLVLGRYRRSAPADLEPLTERLGRVGITTTYQTMHASKGKEADYVLIIGLETGRLSFPSTIPDDPVVRLVLPASETYPFAEERRLYYVALTRARKRVYLLIPPSQVSPFVTELLGPAYASYRTTLVDKPAVYPCSVCQQKTIQAVPGPRGVRWRCTAEPACDGMLTTCPACTMGAMLPTPGPEPAERCAQCGHTARQCPQCRQGILVERTSKHGVFLACSAWRGGDGCRYTQSLSMPPARPNANRPVPPRAQGGPPR
ncbi:MAG TPA: UvrD-helicase domain-containing protein, partial [Herpetosiphonaceae bacterium]